MSLDIAPYDMHAFVTYQAIAPSKRLGMKRRHFQAGILSREPETLLTERMTRLSQHISSFWLCVMFLCQPVCLIKRGVDLLHQALKESRRIGGENTSNRIDHFGPVFYLRYWVNCIYFLRYQ